MADAFRLELVSPERLLLSEDVTAVIVPGSEGYMTVMAHHQPLIATMKPGLVVGTLASGGEKRFYVRGGFADVTLESCTLLAEQAVPMEEFSEADIEQQIRDTEEDVADAATDEARMKAQLQLAELRNVRDVLGM
ncbi:F0F1 ATP synthase subunit epsilon [Consotaella salsifontis]|uniref:ATP synthase epsilon chain n=1 Tax=Consotaella salsifontis TaxID=1365950 RepID=A0A1T4RX40_9HYPH|nr:F0F1 ATP synthase subunit epsilon [Consotaella salsifontis]SKA20550.1 ATP synthase F1 subcomplex epsilon subunit [Consotaella salsifontis]